jgi:hypothetical protein
VNEGAPQRASDRGPFGLSMTTSSKRFPARSGPSIRNRIGSHRPSSTTMAFRSTCSMSSSSTERRREDVVRARSVRDPCAKEWDLVVTRGREWSPKSACDLH